MVQNMHELSTFFRRQVLLSRFIAKFAHGEWIESEIYMFNDLLLILFSFCKLFFLSGVNRTDSCTALVCSHDRLRNPVYHNIIETLHKTHTQKHTHASVTRRLTSVSSGTIFGGRAANVPRKSEPARELLIMPQMPLIVLFTVFFPTDRLLCSGRFLIWTIKPNSSLVSHWEVIHPRSRFKAACLSS